MNTGHLISQTLLGQELTHQECEILSIAVSQRQLEKDDVLFYGESSDNSLYLLINGKLEVQKHAANNQMISIEMLYEGTMSGELSFLDGTPHSMRLVARKPSTVLILEKNSFEALIEQHALLSYHVIRAILRYSHQLQRKMNEKYVEMHRMVQNQYTAHY